MKAIKFIPGLLLILCLCFVACQKETAKIDTKITENFYLRTNGSDMPVWVHGNSESKVFIVTMHGGPGLGYGLDFRRGVYSKSLEEKYAMVYWDQRHAGSSHGHYKKADFTIDAIVEDMNFLLSTLKQRYGNDISLFLMGHSWGGMVSTAFVTKENYQHQLKGWINIAGTPDFNREIAEGVKRIIELGKEEIAAGKSVSEWEEIVAATSTIDISQIPLSKADNKKLFAQNKKAFALVKSNINQGQYGQNEFSTLFFSPAPPPLLIINGLVHNITSPFWNEYINFSLIDKLPKVTIPTLIQFGKYDLDVPPALGQIVYDEVSTNDKYFKIYENSEHAPFETEPELFATDFIEFIELYK